MMRILIYGTFAGVLWQCKYLCISCRYLMGINANNRQPCDEETARDAFSTARSMLEEMLERSPRCQVCFCTNNIQCFNFFLLLPGCHIIAQESETS
jgi:hypothetical protein